MPCCVCPGRVRGAGGRRGPRGTRREPRGGRGGCAARVGAGSGTRRASGVLFLPEFAKTSRLFRAKVALFCRFRRSSRIGPPRARFHHIAHPSRDRIPPFHERPSLSDRRPVRLITRPCAVLRLMTVCHSLAFVSSPFFYTVWRLRTALWPRCRPAAVRPAVCRRLCRAGGRCRPWSCAYCWTPRCDWEGRSPLRYNLKSSARRCGV